MTFPAFNHRLRHQGPYVLALAAPLVLWVTLLLFPPLDIEFLAGKFHLVLMTVVSVCALAVAVLAVRASAKIRQPGVVLLACGCLSVGLALLGHGLTTPFVLGQPLNEWVGRLPYVGLGIFTVCMSLAAVRNLRNRLTIIGDHPIIALTLTALPTAVLTVVVSASPTALHGAAPIRFESDIKLAITIAITCLLLPVSWVHWRRFRLGLDIVQMSLSLAAVMIVAAVISLQFGEPWRLSWWDYHGCLLAGFAGVSYAVFTRWSSTQTAAHVLETAFEDDPLVLIAHNYPAPLKKLVEAIETKDPYTHGHSARTAELAVSIGIRMGLGADQLRTLAQGAYLHDIGKLGIPDEILNKPGRLTPDERKLIETHPMLGFSLASVHEVLAPCLPIILYHHERFDGDGYPKSLAANEIPLLAPIAAVADVWDALTTDRAYRPGWSPQRALDHIVDGAGRHLDPRVVVVLLEIADEAGYRPSGIVGDNAEIDNATSDCHESGENPIEINPTLRRLVSTNVSDS